MKVLYIFEFIFGFIGNILYRLRFREKQNDIYCNIIFEKNEWYFYFNLLRFVSPVSEILRVKIIKKVPIECTFYFNDNNSFSCEIDEKILSKLIDNCKENDINLEMIGDI
jgi:hypothetical protein